MFLKWIENARKKPKAVRNQYAFIGAVSLTAIIVTVWSLSLPAHFAEVNINDEAAETTGAFSQFFTDAKENLASVMAGLRPAEESAESTPPTAASSESRVSVPALTPENVAELKGKDDSFRFSEPRTVLIATTSKDQIATSSQESD